MKNKEEIIVYWAPGLIQSRFHLNYKEPEPVIKELRQLGHNLIHPDNNASNFLKCPAVLNSTKNTFAIASPAGVRIKWDGSNISTPEHDQEFFDKWFFARDTSTGFLSFNLCKYMFFTEEPSLIIKQKSAVYTNNDFTKKIGIIEGSFDIGQWVRALDIGLYFKEPEIVNINIDDVLYYLEFITDKRIIFKKFYYTPALKEMYETCVSVRNTNKFPIKTYFEDMYLLFNQSKMKKRILKEIKDNLLE
tara:strand:+ start:52 stop:792 length:741 start_codon:yes stop_codon:yes gene_type:complete